MKFVTLALNAIAVVFACLCVGTTAVQIVIVAFLWSNGTLNGAKLLRYTAVVYGLDLAQLPTPDAGTQQGKPNDLKTRDEIIESRVRKSKLLDTRGEAIEFGIESVQKVFGSVREESSRFERRKQDFDLRLEKEEQEARQAAIQEVQRILAAMRPKQAKTLIMQMLEDRDLDPADDVMQDIVTMLNNMPPDKTKKIMEQFKTPKESERVNEIFLAIGQLESKP